MLRVGDLAPDVNAELDDGTGFALRATLREKIVVLAFYIKDLTKG